MVLHKPKQTPLGELLLSARQQRGWSRAKLSRETGIGENSLVRYEKAGIEEDGQFPPSSKLAVLCMCLEISSHEALLSCMTPEDFSKFSTPETEDDKYGFPLYRIMAEEAVVYTHQNFKLRAIARAYILEKQGKIKISKDVQRVLEEEFFGISREMEKDEDDIFYPVDTMDDEEIDDLVMKNGPDCGDPDRLNSSDSPTREAVDSSSDHQKLRGDP